MTGAARREGWLDCSEHRYKQRTRAQGYADEMRSRRLTAQVASYCADAVRYGRHGTTALRSQSQIAVDPSSTERS